MTRLLVILALAALVVLAALTTFGSTGGWTAGVVLVAVAAMRLLVRPLLPGATMLLVLVVLGASLFPAVQTAREAARRASCQCRLAGLNLALSNYYDSFGTFPPAFTTDDDGRPMHSWRVRILPYIEEGDLYKRYDFNEPWDGPNNRLLASEMPRVYRCPSDGRPAETGITNYVAIVGPETAWPGVRGRRLDEFGEGRTLLLVESFTSDINWLEPRVLSVDEFLAELAPEPTFVQWWLQLPPRGWRYHHHRLTRCVLLSRPITSWYVTYPVPGDFSPEAARAFAHREGAGDELLSAFEGRRLPAVLAALPVTEEAIRWGGFFTLLAAAVALLIAVRGVRRPRTGERGT